MEKYYLSKPRVKSMMALNGINGVQLSKRLNKTQSAVSALINGKVQPTVRDLVVMSSDFCCPIEELLDLRG